MSDKHGPRMDDELQRDTRAGEDVRDSQRVDDSRPDIVQQHEGVIDDSDADRRAELARSLEPGLFPAHAEELLASARGKFADEWVIDLLERLPDDVYDNLQEVWQAAGGPTEDTHA